MYLFKSWVKKQHSHANQPTDLQCTQRKDFLQIGTLKPNNHSQTLTQKLHAKQKLLITT